VQYSKALVFLSLILIASAIAGANQTQSSFLNLQALIDELHLTPYYNLVPTRRVKIAIFDKGFDGYEKVLGTELPADTKFFEGKVARDPSDATDHGKFMAMLLYDLMTNSGQAPQFAPDIYLYQVNGYTNFREAIDDIIVKKIDMVSYSEVRDTGGNFDGQGVWNTLVNKATSAGIIWANAAGNTARLTYNSEIVNGDDGNVVLPDAHNSLGISCNDTKYKCHVRIVLNWNDFKNVVDAGTDKDLDLQLWDSKGKLVAQSALRQITDRSKQGPGNSLNPREIIAGDINYGQFYIVVKNISNNFTATDKMRIIIDAENDQVTANHFQVEESMLSPADNPNVITVGATRFPQSAVSMSMKKPDLLIESPLYFSGNLMSQGSTNSALMSTAGMGILKSLDPKLDKQALLEYTSHPFDYTNNHYTETKILLGPARSLVKNQGKGLSRTQLGFSGQGSNGCFSFVQSGITVQSYLKDVLSKGVVTIVTDGKFESYKVMTEVDPITLSPNLHRETPSDAVVQTPTGMRVLSRSAMEAEDGTNTAADVEVFQKPSDGYICPEEQDIRATPQMNSAFWLPSL